MTDTATPSIEMGSDSRLSRDATPCEQCGTVGRAVVYRTVGVVRCRSCGLASLLDKPSGAELAEMYSDDAAYDTYVSAQHEGVLDGRYTQTLSELRRLLDTSTGRRTLYDVGAGAGAFLARARADGFDVSGNELSPRARFLCRERVGIELNDQLLENELGTDRFDVITMWCVLAHVADPTSILDAALRLIKPGGVLYFHTPGWCAIDSVGIALVRVSGGRLGQVTQRRIRRSHMRLYNARNLTSLLNSVGFEVLRVLPKTSFSLRTTEYLRGLGVPKLLRSPLAGALDVLIKRSWFPRNILDVYVRKPLSEAPPTREMQ